MLDKGLEPNSEQLLEPIKSLDKFSDFAIGVFKAFRQVNIDFFIQNPVQECSLNIYLIDFIIEIDRQHQNNLQNIRFNNRCKGLEIIDFLFLKRTFDNKLSFVFENPLLLIFLFFENSAAFERFCIFKYINQYVRVFCLYLIEFKLCGFKPALSVFMVFGFLEGLRLGSLGISG